MENPCSGWWMTDGVRWVRGGVQTHVVSVRGEQGVGHDTFISWALGLLDSYSGCVSFEMCGDESSPAVGGFAGGGPRTKGAESSVQRP